MTASHQLPPDAYDAKRARAVHLWNTEPDLTRRDIAARRGVGTAFVSRAVRDADLAGLLKRPMKPESTRESRTGRISGGIGRSHDLGWDRCGGTGGGR